MTQVSEITIIGSGLIGLLTAKEFVNNGCQVTLIDKSLSGQEASWAGGGILLPLYPWRQPQAISTLAVASIKKYPVLVDELFQATQIDSEWQACGLLVCKNPDHELAYDWCHKYQIPLSQADSSFFKHLNTEITLPLWLPSVSQVRNPRLLKSLKAYLRHKKVRLIENCEVKDWVLKNTVINALITTQGQIKINQLIISTGAWTSALMTKLLPNISTVPEITPVKGQMLLFNARPDILSHMILDNEHYLIPRKDGKILVGSSVEYCRFDKSTTAQSREKLYTFATQLLAKLKDFPVSHHWAGLRPGTQRGIPYIDRHPEIKNLSINAGHFRNGLVMAPAAAELMADLILERPPCVPPEPYQLSD